MSQLHDLKDLLVQSLSSTVGQPVGTSHSIRIQRNCSAKPSTLLVVLGGLSAVSLAIGMVFWMMGAPWVLFFSGIEVLAVAVAFFCACRREGD